MSSSAANGISSHLTSILCWTFLPSLFTNLLLSTFYRFNPSSRPTLPSNASASQVADATGASQRHHRRARIALVIGYLAYSVLSVYWAQSSGFAQNYYSLLGISRDVVERDGPSAVKSHWRRLARVYHPDKVGKSGEARFVELRRGVDILEHDGRRWAYERFGPGVTEWGKLVTNREFLVKGATNSAAFWVFAFTSILAISFFRRSERRNNFWRYLGLGLACALEFHLLLRPSPSPTFSFCFPNRLTYEHITLLRQLFVSASMAMSQLSPLLFPVPIESTLSQAEQDAARAMADATALKPLLQRLATLTAAAEAEATALQHLELRPLVVTLPSSPALAQASIDESETDAEATRIAARQRQVEIVRGMREQMGRTFEDLQIKADPSTAKVWTDAIKRGRAREGLRASATGAGQEPEHAVMNDDDERDTMGRDGRDSVPAAPSSSIDGSVRTASTLDLPTRSIEAVLSSPPLAGGNLPVNALERQTEVVEVEGLMQGREGEEETVKGVDRDRPYDHRLPSPPPETGYDPAK
ncbi:hypothetical protein JCM10212_003417 [Sporobolomyces blumeae]